MTRHRTVFSRIAGFSLLIAAAGLVFQGCGGSSSSAPPPNADPTGYYDVTGTATVDDGVGGTISITDLQAIVYNNRIMIYSAANDLLYDGTITNIEQNAFTANVTVYTNGENPNSATVSGTITQGSSITGTLTGTGVGNGTFSLTYATTNSETATLARAANTQWIAMTGPAATLDVEVAAVDGEFIDNNTLFAGLFNICLFDGEVLPIANSNIYSVNLNLTFCSTSSVASAGYSGLAVLRSDMATDDTLVLFATHPNATYGFYTEFQ